MEKFKAGDVVQLRSSFGVKDLMTIEKVNQSSQVASCIWLDPKKKNQLKGDFPFVTIKHYQKPSSVVILR